MRTLLPDGEIIPKSVADGGEGTLEVLSEALGGQIVCDTVCDPLGRRISARYMVCSSLAVIESASVCGITLLSQKELNPLIASSRGLGELILKAIKRGCEEFVIGLGGSATNDGGMGMISVPGFLEAARGKRFLAACDVDTPFTGPNGASRVFGPQKGASPEVVEELEKRMIGCVKRILMDTGVDLSDVPGAGAAGGLAGAFLAYLNASLKPGTELVLDATGFDEILKGADLVITGEGCSDFQTLKGKLPFGILRRAQKQGVPVALLSGEIRDEKMLYDAGFSYIERVSPSSLPLWRAMRRDVAMANMESAVDRLFAKIQTQVSLS